VAEPLIDARGVRKNYGGLRPLRLAELTLAPGDRIAILGIDAPSAEILVNILTGATLPDEGEVRVFGARPPRSPKPTTGWRHSIASAWSRHARCWRTN